MGSRAFLEGNRKSIAQPKLTIGKPNDKYEQEADRIADQVVQKSSNNSEPIQRSCDDCKDESLQMKPLLKTGSTPIMRKQSVVEEDENSTSIDDALASVSGMGEKLDSKTKDSMSRHLGSDFSNVRVHTNTDAAQLNNQIQAKAFTTGTDIYFNRNEYNPTSAEGKRLLAHELTHIVQQQGSRQPMLQKQEAPSKEVKKEKVAKATVADVESYLSNPKLETNAGLQAAIMFMQDRYKPHVKFSDLVFKKLDEKDQKSYLGGSLGAIHGKSSWEGGKPTIWLPQDLLDIAKERNSKIKATLKVGKEGKVHELIRTVGHEMHHLWREKKKHDGNPIQPVYEKEASDRLQKVRDNWLRDIKPNKGRFANNTRKRLEIPQDKKIDKWTDIDKNIREKIEADATDTDYISGLYQRSAYLVEEIYTKIEELSYVRIQQRHETVSKDQPSKSAVNELCRLVYVLNNRLDGMAGPKNLITPKLLKDTRIEMVKYLRKRYPHPSLKGKDAYEVIFYLTSLRGPVPPIYSNGKLISFKPPGSNPP